MPIFISSIEASTMPETCQLPREKSSALSVLFVLLPGDEDNRRSVGHGEVSTGEGGGDKEKQSGQ